VVINNQSAEDYRYSIYHDDLDGSQQVTQHLLTLGHKRIAYLGSALAGRTNQQRLSGYKERMQAAGLSIPGGFIHEVQGNQPETGRAAVEHFLALPERPTAVFCFNDMLATGVLQGLRRAGLRVPQDCSVAGFDNITFSAYTNPPLTTFDQPKHEIGARAARLLLELIGPEGELHMPTIQALRGQLLVRESTIPFPN